jgi:hypothetical protein
MNSIEQIREEAKAEALKDLTEFVKNNLPPDLRDIVLGEISRGEYPEEVKKILESANKESRRSNRRTDRAGLKLPEIKPKEVYELVELTDGEETVLEQSTRKVDLELKKEMLISEGGKPEEFKIRKKKS